MSNQPTQKQIEQAEKDSLYIALMIRHRVNNAKAKLDHFNATRPADRQITEPELIGLTVNEADILLKHFSGYAEKNMQLAGQLAAAQKDAAVVADSLAAVRKQGEIWMRDAKHANDLIGRVMHLFARDQWQVEKQEDHGWIIHTPRVSGVAAHTVIWEDSANPAEALLALILDAAIEDRAGYDSPTLADALEHLGNHGGDVNEKPSTESKPDV